MKRITCKYYISISILVALLTFTALSGCDLLQPMMSADPTGSLTINIGNIGPMSILPNPVIVTYDITISRSGYSDVLIEDTANSTETATDLVIGNWHVAVDGKDSGGAIIAQGDGDINITEAGPNSISITLDLLATGTGTINIDLSWPASVGIDDVTVASKTYFSSSFSTDASLTITNGDPTSTTAYQNTSVVPNQYVYRFNFYKDSVLYASWIESVQVYGNLATTGSITLDAGDFQSVSDAPASISAANTDMLQIDLSWDASPCQTATGYIIRRSTDPAFGTYTETTIGAATTTTYADDVDVVLGTLYYYRIYATNAFGMSGFADTTITAERRVYFISSYYGYHNLTTDAEVNAFAGYTEARGGSLNILGSAITALTPLSSLEKVTGGKFNITCTSITSLIGLEGVTEVDGLRISGTNLTSLSGIDNLTTIGTLELYIGANTGLTSLEGLDSVATVDSKIVIYDNDALPSLAGLGAITTAGGLQVESMASLASFEGLDSLTTITGDVLIYNNKSDSFSNLTGLEALTTVDGDFQLGSILTDYDNLNLVNLMGLSGLTSISGNLRIHPHGALTSLSGLTSLTSVGGIEIGYYYSYYSSYYGSPLLEDLSGLSGITGNVPGDVKILRGYMSSLSGLDNITSIGGDLEIANSDNLTDVSALSNVASIGGDIHVVLNDNAGFDTFALPALTSVGTADENLGYIEFSNNNGIANISMPLLVSVELSVSLIANAALSSLNFPVLSSIGKLSDGRGLYVYNNDALPSFGDFGNLTSIDGSLYIRGNYNLANLDTFNDGGSNLSSIGGHIEIFENYELLNFDGLGSVASMGATSGAINIYVYSNTKLASISGLSGITGAVDVIEIRSNPALQYLTGLDNITSTSSYVYIDNNDLLSSLDALAYITTIDGYLTISGNAILTDVSLSSLTNVAGNMEISTNGALSSLAGLSQLASVDGYLNISSNTILMTFDLPQLISVGGYLMISNPSATTLAGMESLQSIGGALFIQNNANLTNLDGLSGLTSIGKTYNSAYYSLRIYNNDSLTGTGPNGIGLINLATIDQYIEVSSNPVLQSLNGLMNSAVTSAQDINVSWNPLLADLAGLSSITLLTGGLTVYDNDALPNLSWLSDLGAVTGNVVIQDNQSLTAIDMMQTGAKVIGGVLTVIYNRNPASGSGIGLYDSTVDSWIAANAITISGGTNIQYNDPIP